MTSDQRLERAERLLKERRYPSASIELKSLLEAQPNNGRARTLLAEVSLQMGDALAADKELRRAIEIVGVTEQTSDLTARTWLATDRHDELLSRLEGGDLRLHEPKRLVYRGRALLLRQDAESALKAFDDALRRDPKNLEASTGLAQAQLMLGNSLDAESTLRRAVEADPRSFEPNVQLSNILMRDGRVSAAREILQRLAAHSEQFDNDQRARLWIARAEAGLANGDLRSATLAAARVSGLTPNTTMSELTSARIAMAGGRYSAAAAQLQKTLATRPESTKARVLLAETLLAQNQYEQARAKLAELIREQPDDLRPRRLLAYAALLSDKFAGQSMHMTSSLGPDLVAPGAPPGELLNVRILRDVVPPQERRFAPETRAKIDLVQHYLRMKQYAKAEAVLRMFVPDTFAAEEDMLLTTSAFSGRVKSAGGNDLAALRRHFPDDLRLLNIAGMYFASVGEFERARLILGRALSAHPDDLLTLLNSVRVELAAGERQTARFRLERLVRERPHDVAAQVAMAELATSSGDLQRAAMWLEQVRSSDPDLVPIALELTQLYRKQQQTNRAIAVLQSLQPHVGSRGEVLNAIGLLYLECAKPNAARSSLEAAVRSDPSNSVYLANLARAYLALGDVRSSQVSVTRAFRSDPSSLQAIGAELALDARRARAGAAARRLSKLIAESPSDPDIRMLEGDFNMSIRAYESAAGAYAVASRSRVDRETSLKLYRARELARLGNAAESLEAWVERHPEDFELQRELAQHYYARDQRERAIEKYSLLVRNEMSDPVTLSTLALLYHETGDDRGEELAQRAFEMARQDPSVANIYGRILMSKGAFPAAVRALEAAAGAHAQDPDLNFRYAQALARAGRRVDALARLRPLLAGREPFASRPEAKVLMDELSE